MRSIVCSFLMVLLFVIAASGFSEPLHPVDEGQKCPVCGMLVAKYEQWLSQIVIGDQKPLVFDGVKDMMAYYFNVEKYGGKGDMSAAEIWVRNYYTLDYINGREAYFVVGSDVLGPMGAELIPFSTQKEADNFKKDHGGSSILRFDEIEAGQIMEMKKKQMMKMKKMKAKKQTG